MNTFLSVLGGLIFLISLFITWLSWGFIRRNKRIARLGNGNDRNLDPQMYGRPRLFMQFGIIGILVGAILFIINI